MTKSIIEYVGKKHIFLHKKLTKPCASKYIRWVGCYWKKQLQSWYYNLENNLKTQIQKKW